MTGYGQDDLVPVALSVRLRELRTMLSALGPEDQTTLLEAILVAQLDEERQNRRRDDIDSALLHQRLAHYQRLRRRERWQLAGLVLMAVLSLVFLGYMGWVVWHG